MLVYQSLDLINDQYLKIKTEKEQENKSKEGLNKLFNESNYLGLLFESNIGEYELDVYAFISNTRYKYILLKNDRHQIQRNIGSIQS